MKNAKEYYFSFYSKRVIKNQFNDDESNCFTKSKYRISSMGIIISEK